MSDVLTPDEERVLLDLARRAIGHYFETGEHLQPDVKDPKLGEKRGAFVTLKVKGELRGCIGYPLPYKPLAETIVEMAVAAASQDFRFEPLTPGELAGTRIEISVLSLPEPVKDPKEVEVGRHGIVVAKGFNRGLLLPQVPLEYHWDRETYLRHGCLKAGLGPDEWKKGAKIEVFTAQVFSEPE
ncbi:MAG: AmmeMemoRadiSam system protein A [Candidatus Aminicenantales bacterium]|jgi:AmmeMemoRadiSam system protein A